MRIRGLISSLAALSLSTHAWAGGGEPPVASDAVGCVQIDRDAGIVTFELRNGVLVHYRRTPGASGVGVCATLAGVQQMEGEKTRGLSMGALATIAPRLSLHTRMSSSAPEGVRILFVGPRTQLEANARVIGELLAAPTVSGAGIADWKARYVRMLTEPVSDPATVAARALQDLIADQAQGGDARRRSVTAADIQAITPEAAVAWQRRLWAELPIEVGVSADLPMEEVVPPVIEALASVPARPDNAWARLAEMRRSRSAPGRRLAEVQANLQMGDAVTLVALPAPDMADLHAHRAMVVAKSLLAERVQARLHATGLSIAERGLSLALSPGRGLDGSGLLVITVRLRGEPDCARIASKVIKDAILELANPDAPGAPTAADVSKHAEQVVADAKAMTAEASYWAGVLSVLRTEGWRPSELVHAAASYRAITPADVARVLGACGAEDRMYTVLLTPDGLPQELLGKRP